VTLQAINAERAHRMRACLNVLAPTVLEIDDDSARHAGHAGSMGGHGHFTVRIESAAFNGLSMLACHRLVYQALGAMMQTDIHALALKTAPTLP
jgi:BolA family transcriptional regulator, general stress-responsive regulator